MDQALRILHLEDNPRDAELVKAILAGNGFACKLTIVETGEAFKSALEREEIDLILADYTLPSYSGLDALKFAASTRPETPFIFVSGVMGEEFAVLTLHLGATDYVLKSNLIRLPAAVRRAIEKTTSDAMKRQLEDSQRLHATRMASLMDSSPDAIIVMDAQGVILDWNRQAESMFGWHKADVLGRTVAELIIPPRHREAHNRGLSQFMTTGVSPISNRRVELTALHRALGEFPVELTVTAYQIKNQWQFTEFIKDNTEYKRAELRKELDLRTSRALIDSNSVEETCRKLLEAFCDVLGWVWAAIWVLDKDAKVLRNMICWHKEEIAMPEFEAMTRLTTFTAGVGLPGRVWANGRPANIPDVTFDDNFPRKPAAVKDGLHGAVGFPILLGGDIIGVMELFSPEIREVDHITMDLIARYSSQTGVQIERKRAHEELTRQTVILKSVMDNIGEGVVVADMEGRFLFWNPVATAMLGQWSSDVPTEQWPERYRLFLPDQATPFPVEKLPLLRAIRGEAVDNEELYVRRPDNSAGVWLSVSGRALIDESNVQRGGVVTMRDITKHKEGEQARLSQLAAERANQTKNEFLSRMSHELRTPLNAVLGFAQLMEMDELKPEQREHVHQILKGGRHLLALINEVLDISRIEAGRMTLSLEPVSVSSVIGEAVDLIRPQAAGRNILLVTQTPWKEEVFICADRQRVKQVLLNILSNGVKYNKDGGSLTVSCQAVPVGRYRVTVTDTGGGIPSALMSRLFTPFDRLGANATIEGTGLGLVLSRNLVAAMGGTLEVDSVEGRGTSFTVELPLSEPPAARETAMAPDKGRVTAPVSGGTFTVLYIEDNLPNYQLVERLVAKRPGVRLLGAMQGKLGVELAVAHHPDVILLDLNLPDIQGDEVLLRLRERPETAAIPVVMLSADAMQRQVDRLLAAGAQKYLTKPIEVTQFYALLDELMTKKGGR